MIFGFGETGLSVARFWTRRGIPFSIIDDDHCVADKLDGVCDIAPLNVHFGEIDPTILNGVTEMVVSPGIPLDHQLVERAKRSGSRIRGDIDLFMEACRKPVIGITGSNGKSTVTTMLSEIISACGVGVSVGGNIGRPALDLLEDEAQFFVLELSSFQLERSESLGLEVAAVTNISQDHLDRYESLPKYHRAKHKIFHKAKHVVANREDPLTVPILGENASVAWWRPTEPDLNELGIRIIDGVKWICLGMEPLISGEDLRLSGHHNLLNTLTALAIGTILDLPLKSMVKGAVEYKGLPHRCELIAEINSVRFIDDSKATNIAATLAAINGLADDGPIWLILGGQKKGQDFSLLKDGVSKHCLSVCVLGEASTEIAEQLRDLVPVHKVVSLESAISLVMPQVRPGHLVLLSPACASFDMFDSYVDRGIRFQNAVRKTGITQ